MIKKDTNTNLKKSLGSPIRGLFFSQKTSHLVLADKKVFKGVVPSYQTGTFYGEVVFNTGMTGYIESLTDPSYSGQILVFTYPLIGNYGVPTSKTWESEKIHAAGVVVSSATELHSHSQATQSFLDWLKQQNIPIIMDVDTRALTKHLRSSGTMMGAIGDKVDPKLLKIVKIPKVTITNPIAYDHKHKKTVVLVDCGAKLGILNSLLDRKLNVVRVPYNYDYTKDSYDGVLISNGPGDPTDYPEAVNITKKAIKNNKPIFGICLGTQVLGLAVGAKTYKLPYGHRGHNQPCMDMDGSRCYITSQNHGYAINDKTLPKDWSVSFRNLNDNSVEGIEHRNKPFFAVQFHPEARPGPTDTNWLFDKFVKSL